MLPSKSKAKTYILLMLSEKLPKESFAKVEDLQELDIHQALMKHLQELIILDMELNAENLFLLSKDPKTLCCYMDLIMEQDKYAFLKMTV